MAAIYHVRIKKEYAAAVIEDLQKMGAIELVELETNREEIPEWQQEAVRRRIAARKADPTLLIDREEAEAAIKMMGK